VNLGSNFDTLIKFKVLIGIDYLLGELDWDGSTYRRSIKKKRCGIGAIDIGR
jgi:hypothetical protein